MSLADLIYNAQRFDSSYVYDTKDKETLREFAEKGFSMTEKEFLNKQKSIDSDFVATGYITTSNAGGFEVEIHPSGDSARLKDESGVTDWMEIEFVQNIDDPTGDLVPVINPDGYHIPLDQVMRIDRFPGDKTYTQADFQENPEPEFGPGDGIINSIVNSKQQKISSKEYSIRTRN